MYQARIYNIKNPYKSLITGVSNEKIFARGLKSLANIIK
jgi:hypothetical protein